MKNPKRNRLSGLILLLGIAGLAACRQKSHLPGGASPTTLINSQKTRLEWNMATLADAYQKSGKRDPSWDAAAIRALTAFAHERAGIGPDLAAADDVVKEGCAAAVAAGCDDPLIRYLYDRTTLRDSSAPEAYAQALREVATSMQNTDYSPVRKAYAAIRTLDQYKIAYSTNLADAPGLQEVAAFVWPNIASVVADPTVPAEEVYEVCGDALSDWANQPDGYLQAYSAMSNSLLQNWPNAASTYLLQGNVFHTLAWFERGGGYSKDVDQEKWKGFFEKLAVAEASYKKAWDLDPKDERIPTQMVELDTDLQRSRADMEVWFKRAMDLDPDNYTACQNKLRFLEPRWYGSREEMLTFGRQCVTTTKWGGAVPLILVDAHYQYAMYSLDKPAERETYWKQQDVWADIKGAYERFFAVNPDDTWHLKNYAWYAYHAEQWQTFLDLAPRVPSENQDFFGPPGTFDEMVKNAKGQVK